jgi:outer membrane protein OmpA-like peptidoglycan-associated protein
MDVNLHYPAVDSKGMITVNGSSVLPHLNVSFGLHFNYGRNILEVPARRGKIDAVETLLYGILHFNIGLFNSVAVGLHAPVTIIDGTFPQNADGGALIAGTRGGEYDAQGFGDVIFYPKIRILRIERNLVGLAFIPAIVLPSGDSRYLLGEPGVAFAPQLVIDTTLIPRIVIGVNLGYKLITGTKARLGPGGYDFEYGDQIIFKGGIGFEVYHKTVDIIAEIYGSSVAKKLFQTIYTPFEIIGGVKIHMEDSFLLFGVGAGLNNSYASSDLRAFGAWIFEPSIGDRDRDGIPDDVDRCPDDPEDFDDFEDEDGCPEPDNDRDGILDVDDECPLVPEDKDGIEDGDGCPEEEKEQDRDGDGIPDSLDQCPDEPEDKDGFQDEDGCPDPDNDGDGILDVDDLCPNEPEDKDGFQDEDGCPDPDNDGDRILDVDDQCPNDPETYNGFEDEDGCPDKGRVIKTKEELIILDKVYFATNSAKILPKSYPILDAVAATLKGNPQILLVEIQGHADERASDKYNLDLTQRRANSVLKYLVNKGIDPRRLRARGYGERCPVDPRHNEKAWEKNRRVEFKIVITEEGPTGVKLACPAAEDLFED